LQIREFEAKRVCYFYFDFKLKFRINKIKQSKMKTSKFQLNSFSQQKHCLLIWAFQKSLPTSGLAQEITKPKTIAYLLACQRTYHSKRAQRKGAVSQRFRAKGWL